MVQVNCGKCYPCLSNRRNEWTFRMMQETKYSESSLFITLTYKPEEIKYAWCENTGGNAKFTIDELIQQAGNESIPGYKIPSLIKKDLVDFNKRLRQAIIKDKTLPPVWFKVGKNGRKNPIYRFWGIGEYGDKSNRPHYHLIAWNLPDTWFKYDPIHKQYYSEKIEKLWNKGLIHIGTVTQQSIHYVAKYALKELTNNPNEWSMVEEPFCIMSRRPGIGQAFINDRTKNYFNNTLDPYATIENNFKYPLPRFYTQQLWDDETRSKVAEKARLWSEEKEERERKQIESSGGNFEDYQIATAVNGYKAMKRQLTKKQAAL